MPKKQGAKKIKTRQESALPYLFAVLKNSKQVKLPAPNPPTTLT